jgi:hypothetical protein
MIRLTETVKSREASGAFLGRTWRRGLGVASFFKGETGRVGERVLRETRLVLLLRVPEGCCFGGLLPANPLGAVVAVIAVSRPPNYPVRLGDGSVGSRERQVPTALGFREAWAGRKKLMSPRRGMTLEPREDPHTPLFDFDKRWVGCLRSHFDWLPLLGPRGFVNHA